MASRSATQARRSEIARLRVQRLSTREIAALLDISQSAVQRHVTVLNKEWSADRGDYADQQNAALSDLDTWQGMLVQDLPALPAERRSTTIDTLLRLQDQRSKMLNLYPKPGTSDGEELETGPIRLTLTVVEAGNRQLVLEPDAILDDDGAIDIDDLAY